MLRAWVFARLIFNFLGLDMNRTNAKIEGAMSRWPTYHLVNECLVGGRWDCPTGMSYLDVVFG
jgi:hypothetical protein